MTDPIADFIIRIKNAFLAKRHEVLVPYSKMKHSLAEILIKEGYLDSVAIDETGPFKQIVLQLKYVKDLPSVTDVKRLSKPGRRLYSTAADIPRALGGYGITIVSTSRGIMTDKQAKKQNVGGELLCQVW